MGLGTVSIIIRALNEERWLREALSACRSQTLPAGRQLDLVLVDSGSTDGTLDIAAAHGCRIVKIRKDDFTFGRALNVGCEAARGDVLVFLSAHCIPTGADWLETLIKPVEMGVCEYAYGRQVGHETSRFSERRVFAHYFSDQSAVPQVGVFCNNANAAIRASTWSKFRFDEVVTGLEDMVLAKTIVNTGGHIGYVADAAVAHIHNERLTHVQRRYYREALTMRQIMPEVHFNIWDMTRCFVAGVLHDWREAIGEKVFLKEAAGVIGFRFHQYWGTYRGHNEHRVLSQAQKVSYYYPHAKTRKRPVAGLASGTSDDDAARTEWGNGPVTVELTRD